MMKKKLCFVALLFVTTLSMAAAYTNLRKYNNTQEAITSAIEYNPAFEFSSSAQMDAMVKAYLKVKDALVTENHSQASDAGSALITALKQLEKTSDKDKFGKAGKAALKSAFSLSKATSIKEQRSAFKDLSESIYQLLKDNGNTTTLYFDYCPMAKASWLSDKKAIENPYYGQSMLSCGIIKDTLNP